MKNFNIIKFICFKKDNLLRDSFSKIQRRMSKAKEVSFDPRMTEESKKFIGKFSKLMDRKLYKQLNLDEIRNLINTSTFILNEKLKVENVIEKEYFVQNLDDNYDIPVTAYIPNNVASKYSPITIYFHGGGWTICSRKTHHHAIKILAQKTNSIWLSVEYRLAPEYKFPTCLDDCTSVVKWVVENKSKYFNSPLNSKIGIAGDSAGGTMAASIGHELKKLVNFQILIYPCVQFNMAYASYKEFQSQQYLLTPALLKYFTLNLINDLEEINLPRLAPMLNENFDNLPNTLIIAAELDPLVDDSKEYHKKLQETGNKSELHVIKGVQHGFFNLPGILPNAFHETSEYIIKFLKKFFLDEKISKL